MSSPEGHRPEFLAEQEVRFAVVLYGGVSLAVYINGVVQELMQLVRATAPALPVSQTPKRQRVWFTDEQLKGSTAAVYRRVGQRLPKGGATDATVRTRFVVDILSGTSAGGINAIFMAKAIANQQDIGALRTLWVEQAGISDLLNESKQPNSLLSGDLLYNRARAALNGMEETTQAPTDAFMPSYADELDLAVTTTDLQGLPLRLDLSRQTVYETRHRNVLRFKYAGHQATGEEANDFGGNDDLLAFAARSTSAFPFAFEPAVAQDAPVQAGVPETWKDFYPDYVARGADYTGYAFADGGYLDNKPFSYATDALRRRRADVPVTRVLLYVEPDPEGPPRTATSPAPSVEPKDPPDAFENTVASFLLPRHETIREDLEAVLARNRTVEQIRAVVAEMAAEVLDGKDPLRRLHRLPPATADEEVLERIPFTQLSYRAYLQLRFDAALDDLAAAIVRRGGGRDDPSELAQMRALVLAGLGARAVGGRRAFLHELDVRFRIRRIAFLQDCISKRCRSAHSRELVELKRALNERLIDLRTAGRNARRDAPESAAALLTRVRADEPADDAQVSHHVNVFMADLAQELEGALSAADAIAMDDPELAELHRRYESLDMVSLPLTYPGLEDVNPVGIVRVAPEDATWLVTEGPERPAKLGGLQLGHFGGFLDARWRRNDILWGRLDAAELILRTVLPDADAKAYRTEILGAILREELVEQDGGELSDRLAGAIALSDETARKAVERFSGDASQSARAAVRAALKLATDEELVTAFQRSHGPVAQLEAEPMARVGSRAARITGKILDQGAKKHNAPVNPGFWLARLGRVAWGVVEVANPVGRPARLTTLVFRNWTQLALLLAIVLIVGGALLGLDEAPRLGWWLAGLALVAQAAVWLTGALLSRRGARAKESATERNVRRGLAAAVLVGILVAIAAAEWIALAGAIAAALGAIGLVHLWLTTAPDRYRLKIVGAVAVALLLALAVVEVLYHAGEDASNAVARLPGERDTSAEGVFRDAWDAVWPGSAGPALPPGTVGLAGERGTVFVKADDDLATLRRQVEALRDAAGKPQRELGDLLRALLAERSDSSEAALRAFLKSNPQLSPQAAALVLAVLARG
jgi:patatin-related protein